MAAIMNEMTNKGPAIGVGISSLGDVFAASKVTKQRSSGIELFNSKIRRSTK